MGGGIANINLGPVSGTFNGGILATLPGGAAVPLMLRCPVGHVIGGITGCELVSLGPMVSVGPAGLVSVRGRGGVLPRGRQQRAGRETPPAVRDKSVLNVRP